LIVTSVPATSAAPVLLYSDTLIVPVVPVRTDSLTAIPSMVIAPGVKADERVPLYAVVKTSEPVSEFKYEVASTVPHVEADVKLPVAMDINTAIIIALIFLLHLDLKRLPNLL